MDAILNHRELPQSRRDFVGHGEKGRGRGEDALGHLLCGGTIQEAAMPRLLLDQWRIDFEQTGAIRFLGVFHACVTPERVALVDEIEGAVVAEQGGEPLIGDEAGSLLAGKVIVGDCRQPVQANIVPTRGPLTVAMAREQIDLGAGGQHGADHFAHMYGAAFPPEDRHSPVGTDVGNAHQLTSRNVADRVAARQPAASRKMARIWAALRWMSNSLSIKRRARAASSTRRFGSASKRSRASASPAGS